MYDFQFFHGYTLGISLPREPDNIGIINDFYENGVNTLGYEPYRLMRGNRVFQSDVCHRSYNEWVEIINTQTNFSYFLYAVLRPDDDYREQEVVYLDGAANVFPLFVLENPDRQFLFEFIVVPDEGFFGL